MSQTVDIMGLTKELCSFKAMVVSRDNEAMFKRIERELPLKMYRFASGSEHNGWVIPQYWEVKKALIRRGGKVVFDGTVHTLGVAMYSKSFQGELDFEELKKHLVTSEKQPKAHIFHCMWQYRSWDPDWAFCVPYETYKTFGPGTYQVELVTSYEKGEMLVGEYTHHGTTDDTIFFNCHTCHPHMANDSLASVATLIHLFQWLKGQKTHYTYKLILGPEHLGTVFYLKDRSAAELKKMLCGVYTEMAGTPGPIKAASTFHGKQIIDRIFENTLKHYSKAYVQVPWRQGAGNDETVWEAPGYEIPFVELTRCIDMWDPYPEYHTSLDTPESLDPAQVQEFLPIFQKVINAMEKNATMMRQFDGLICLSNPKFNLYMERPDPSINKNLAGDSEKWGQLTDSLLRYFDGSHTILDIAEKHDLPFDLLQEYIAKFADKGLIKLTFAPIPRVPISVKGR